MKKLLFTLLVVLVSVSFARRNAWDRSTGTAFYDTILEFNADSLKYSETFNLSGFDYFLMDVYVDDSSSVGFSADSTKFAYGIQTGHYAYDSIGLKTISWNPIKFVVDTFTRYDSLYADSSLSYVEIPADADYSTVKSVKDSTSVPGFVYQSTSFPPIWDVFYRGWFQGLTGNDKGSLLDIRVLFTRRMVDGD